MPRYPCGAGGGRGGPALTWLGQGSVPGHGPTQPLLFSQVLGASEEPTQFSLTNAAGTHTTSEGISLSSSGELVFSSFHSLLAGPYFWNLPAPFRGDKVGRDWAETSSGGHWERCKQRQGSSVGCRGEE